MRSNYKPLGKYIQRVENRNRDLKVTRLLGLSMTKEFRETTSNIVGTDMSVYRVMSKYQFACDFMSPIRVNKLPVVLKLDDEPNLVSPAYPVFEIKNRNELDPEYLMMWFRRPEFDRYATFKCDAAIRGGYEWTELCETLIPVPHIEKQREIVAEYNTVQKRIDLNNQLIIKLEETAQAIYKEWFVDGIDTENLPEGWEIKSINEICEITSSKRIFENEYQNSGIPFYRGKEITQKKKGETINEPIFISENRYNEITKSFGKILSGDILMTAVGTIGSTYMVQEKDEFYFKDGNVIWFKNFVIDGLNYYLYDFMQSELFFNYIQEITIGSTQSAVTITTFGKYTLVIPDENTLKKYLNASKVIWYKINIKSLESQKLNELKAVLLSKLATIEN